MQLLFLRRTHNSERDHKLIRHTITANIENCLSEPQTQAYKFLFVPIL